MCSLVDRSLFATQVTGAQWASEAIPGVNKQEVVLKLHFYEG